MSQLKKIALFGFVLVYSHGMIASDNGLRSRKNNSSDKNITPLASSYKKVINVNHDVLNNDVKETQINNNKDDSITVCCKAVMAVPYGFAALIHRSSHGIHDLDFLSENKATHHENK